MKYLMIAAHVKIIHLEPAQSSFSTEKGIQETN